MAELNNPQEFEEDPEEIDTTGPPDLSPLEALGKDRKQAAKFLSRLEARFLVDYYYAIQEDRVRAQAQEKAARDEGDPHEVLSWVVFNTARLEGEIKKALDSFGDSSELGRWSKSICGIGPIIAAGLLSHIDIEKAPTVGHIWSFAGLDPTKKWERGKKRPWNADLKVLCWKLGESFVKTSTREEGFYGRLWKERREKEWMKNLNGDFVEQAVELLESAKFARDKDVWYWLNGFYTRKQALERKENPKLQLGPDDLDLLIKKAEKAKDQKKRDLYVEIDSHANRGKRMLSPGHVHARAKRWATKIFLSHWHEVAYRTILKKMPPNPFAIEFLGHTHYIPVQNLDLIPLLEGEKRNKIGR